MLLRNVNALVSSGSTVAEYFPPHPNVNGFNPDTAAGNETERK